MPSIVEEIRDAVAASGLTLDDLIKATGLPMSRSCMSRKLRGVIELGLLEAASIAFAVDCRIVQRGRSLRLQRLA